MNGLLNSDKRERGERRNMKNKEKRQKRAERRKNAANPDREYHICNQIRYGEGK
jgi:hypothetical protein